MKLSVKSTLETFRTIEKGIQENKKFYYTRFGDGEFINMMGRDKMNSKASPDLQKELIECFTINEPNFIIASAINIKKEKKMSDGVFAPFSFNNELENFVLENKLYNKTGVYENYISFHYLSVFYPKIVYEFLEEYIRPKKKMFIGCSSKIAAEKLYGKIDYYVNIPRQFAYDNIKNWWPTILKNIDKVELVIPSAGVCSNVISKRLWHLDKEIQLLDIGSIIDAVEGDISRTWIRLVGHRINKILPFEYREKRILKRIWFFLIDIKNVLRSIIK